MKLNKLQMSLAVAGLMALFSVARAQVTLVSDTSDNLAASFPDGGRGNDLAETFSTGPAGGTIAQIILGLNFTGVTHTGIYLYATSGAPASYETLQIGTVSTTDNVATNSFGQTLYRVELNAGAVAANPLAAGTDYALSVGGQGAGALSWDSIAIGSASTGTGSFLSGYYYSSGNWTPESTQMPGMEVDVQPVPEPSTLALFIVGGIALPVSTFIRNRVRGQLIHRSPRP